MKRVYLDGEDERRKKIRVEDDKEEAEKIEGGELGSGFVNFDDNLLFEVFKHVDAKSLAMAACVNKQWYKTSQDERLWELICTKQWANIGCGNQQLRSVVLALGGFRRLHSLYIWPLSKPQSSSSASTSWGPLTPMISSKPPTRWGKDEVNIGGGVEQGGGVEPGIDPYTIDYNNWDS